MKTINGRVSDKLLQELLRKYECADPNENEQDFGILLALDELDRLRRQIKVVELVKVTKCRDCIQRASAEYERLYCEPGETCCQRTECDTLLDGFCNNGEKMGGGD